MNEITTHPLYLISKELNVTLLESRQALERYAEAPQQRDSLERCIDQLHLAQGALRLVEVYGAALLAEEMEHVCRFLLDDPQRPEDRGDALDALTRGMVQLPMYIDRVQGGGRDLALVLLPVLNDLRAARRRPLLSEGTLLLLNLTPDSHASVAERQTEFLDVDIAQLGRRVRLGFERGLLGWIRGDQPDANLARMARVAEILERAAQSDAVYQLWWVIGGVLEALREGGLDTSVAVKRLLGQADLQIKRLIVHGENAFIADPAIDLLNNLLYYIGRATSSGARVAAIRASFSLAELLPADEQVELARESLSAPSVKLMQTVATAIKEDLSRVKDVLDIYVRTGMGQADDLAPQLDMLKKISDTLGVLGLGDLRGHVQAEIAQLQEIVADKSAADDATLVKMAATLLSVEDNLDGHLMRLIVPADATASISPGDGDTVRALEFRQVTEAVIRECIVNLARVKEAISQSIDNPADAQVLDSVPGLLRGIMAGLLMLNKTRAVDLVERIGGFIRDSLRPGRRPLPQVKLDLMADAVVSIEYYMETVQAGRSDPWYMLDNAQACIESLEEVDTGEIDLAITAESPGYVRTVTLESSREVAARRPFDPAATEVLGGTLPVIAAADGQKPDPEFLELFIEEAREEIASVERNFPSWADSPADSEALVTLRRSFHTLKGSGRMVGAQLIGEFAWSVEDLLNRLINGTLERTPQLMEILRRAVAALPELVEQLEVGTAPHLDVAALIADVRAQSEPAAAPAAVAATASEPGEAEGAPPAIDPVLREIFTKETAEHLGVLRKFVEGCRGLESPYPLSEELYRACHTLNGSANMAGVTQAATVAGPWSAYVRNLFENRGRLDDRDIEACAGVIEAIQHVIDTLHEEGTPPRDHSLLVERIHSLGAEFEEQLAQRGRAGMDDRTDADAGALSTGRTVDASPAFADTDELEASQNLAAAPPGFELSCAVITDDAAAAAEYADVFLLRFVVPDPESLSGAVGAELLPEAHEGAAFEPLPASPAGPSPRPASAAEREPAPATGAAPQPGMPPVSIEAPETDTEIAAIFGEEAVEILDAADGAIAALADGHDSAHQVVVLQRQLHTLKGGARMAGMAAMGDLSHELESLLGALDEGRVELTSAITGLLQQGIDELHRMRETAAGGRPVQRPDGLLRRVANAAGAAPVEEAEALEPEETVAHTGDPAAERGRPAGEPAVEAAQSLAAVQGGHALAREEPVPDGEKAPEPEAAPAGTLPDEGVEWAEDAPVEAARAPRRETGYDRQEFARVDADLLEDLLNNAGEISIFRSRLQQQLNSIEYNLAELTRTVTRLRDQLRALEGETEAQILHRHQDDTSSFRRDFDPLELDRYSTIQQLSRALAESVSDVGSIRDLLENLTTETDGLLVQQGRVTTELQNGLMRTRMVPFYRHAQRLNRIVRLAASETGKQAELILEGATGELDRQVTERMLPPIEHMLRNAVIHGIEPPEQRQGRGKPPLGRIRIRLHREGSEMVIEVADDGAGLDVARIKQRAVERGLIQLNQRMSDETAMELILKPGFSTARELTQAAGRGVGMEIVANEVQKLGGSLRITSQSNEGTTFTVRLPFMLAISQALVVKVGEERFALPLPTVEGVARLRRSDVEKHLGEPVPTFSYGGQKYRFQHLGRYLDGPPAALPEEDGWMSVILVRAGDHSTALITDEMVGSQEIVVKPVGPQIAGIKGITGATILGDGSIVIIIDAGVLVREVRPTPYFDDLGRREQEDRRTLVLVVDDSITVRRVTQRLLERNGMRVLTAKDGIDAVSIMQDHRPDVILLDIEMPRMDGYEFASHVRNDNRLRDVPIIMITSRVSEKHRARAIELGVNDYLGKPYQESQLLEAVESLAGAEQVAM
ncbi:MAG TPA: Hpt domain-containing protein [Gammaproteobacteria bacterium]|nr:Hpt domain-containing protein [Gammaproteobacteria bacterium]